MKKFIFGMITTLVMGAMLVPSFALAGGDADAGIGDYGEAFGTSYGASTGLGEGDVRNTIGRIINISLSLLGIVSLVIILFAGFEWMTAGGNDDKVSQARKRMIAGVIGLAIILSSYALSTFVLRQLGDATEFNTESIDDR